MNDFQFDECIDSKTLFNSCSAQGLAKPIRFPANLKGTSDEQLLPSILSKPYSFLTCDSRIVRQHHLFIPALHPGIIMIANAPGHYPSLTEKTIINILDNFKKHLPWWNTVPWKNSIVKITQQFVEISRIKSGIVEEQIKLDYSDPDFKDRLEEILTSNAS
jgi:hypothetical protein